MKITEKHPLWLRLVHWLNVPVLGLMIWSGLLIYWANDIYPGFFPDWFYNAFKINGKLAEGLAVHFFAAWFFILIGVIYLAKFILSGHWREILPTKETFKYAIPTVLHDMGLRETAPAQGKFNAIQRLAYSGFIVLGILMVLTGFAIYKPVQLHWLAASFGGYKTARLVHFSATILICVFIFVHVLQVIRAGWNNFRAMIAGFEVNDESEK